MRLSFIEADGQKLTVDAQPGESVMQAAVRNGIEGIVGECGGSLSCATCHVYVRAPDGTNEQLVDEMEDAMLDGAASERRPNSRLCCQITVTEDLSEWGFEIPETQY
ncbi:2Fe-2S iron-sulfur cluster-binding protein [Microbaculum sp. FT89]|uniref:2Fe-2S iron-sulfur cluster-binding protein n=1 Tax=Microbaculum sp. FT89 TaxID=3447298 RepID=UPI003F52B752